MTNDFDDLVSAYVDGQATPDEVARLEADPGLLAEADALRQLSAEIADVPPAPPALRSDHLATALDAFDRLGAGAAEPGEPGPITAGAATSTESMTSGSTLGTGDGGPAPMVDLGRQRSRRRRFGSPGAGGVPSWLGAAAALLLVIGGLGFVISQIGSGGDDDDTAAIATDTASADEATDEGEVAEAAEEAAELAEADERQLGAASADSDTAEAESADDAGDLAGGDGGASPTTTAFRAEFDPEVEVARIQLDDVPAPELLEELALGDLVEPERARCSVDDVGRADLEAAELIGFVPISVDDRRGEVLVLADDGGTTVAVVAVDETCAELS